MASGNGKKLLRDQMKVVKKKKRVNDEWNDNDGMKKSVFVFKEKVFIIRLRDVVIDSWILYRQVSNIELQRMNIVLIANVFDQNYFQLIISGVHAACTVHSNNNKNNTI